jgi:hypothetical protein
LANVPEQQPLQEPVGANLNQDDDSSASSEDSDWQKLCKDEAFREEWRRAAEAEVRRLIDQGTLVNLNIASNIFVPEDEPLILLDQP